MTVCEVRLRSIHPAGTICGPSYEPPFTLDTLYEVAGSHAENVRRLYGVHIRLRILALTDVKIRHSDRVADQLVECPCPRCSRAGGSARRWQRWQQMLS